MKRHKYGLRKHLSCWTKIVEREHHVLLSFKSQTKMSEFKELSSAVLQKNYLPVSKLGAYCMISGRVRFTFSLTSNTRHVFFERWCWGLNTGFFMSSW